LRYIVFFIYVWFTNYLLSCNWFRFR